MAHSEGATEVVIPFLFVANYQYIINFNLIDNMADMGELSIYYQFLFN